jgi:hypothetical protein
MGYRSVSKTDSSYACSIFTREKLMFSFTKNLLNSIVFLSVVLTWPNSAAFAADYSVTGITLGMDIHEALKQIGSGFSMQPDKIIDDPGFTQYMAQRQILGYYTESYLIYTLDGLVVYVDHTKQYPDCVHINYSAPQPCDANSQLTVSNTISAAIQKYGEPTETKVNFSTEATWFLDENEKMEYSSDPNSLPDDLCNDFSEIPVPGCFKSLSIRIRPVGGQDSDIVDQIEVALKDSKSIIDRQEQDIQKQKQELQNNMNMANQNKPNL